MIVSIITAYYKGQEYLRDYVKMVRRNASNLSADDSIEVILVNDSPNEEIDVPKCNHPKADIRIITNPKNLGIHQSRINGLKEAKGDYVIFLDQDDLLGKNAVKTYIENANMQDEVLVCNAALGQREGYLKWYRENYHIKQIGNLDCYCNVGIQIISPGHTCIYKKAIPKEWIEYVCTYNGADDYFLWLLMLSKGVEFKYIDKVLYLHRYTGENLSSDTNVTDESTLQFCNYLDKIDYFPDEYVEMLRQMVNYKAEFRAGSKFDKISCSMKNRDLLAKNIEYKFMTKTPLGFNRD